MKPLRYAIIGFGPNARGHVLENAAHPKIKSRMQFVAGYDPDPGAREKIAAKGVHVAESYEDLIAMDGLEAVMISSPPQFHAAQATAAMDAGLHVFSEVPMAINADDAKKIVDVEARNPRVVYQFGENYAFITEVLYAGHLVRSGRIGRPVYCECEYLHDVTYRWRQGRKGGPETPRVDSWYSLFDPLAYGHSIGPAQLAMGGGRAPEPFVEVKSYATSRGAGEDPPVCHPAEAFHVALFKTASGAVARCAAAYVFAREPVRRMFTLTGELGSFECQHPGKAAYLFEANGHVVTARKHRDGKHRRLGRWTMSREIPFEIGGHWGGNVRVKVDWLDAIAAGRKPTLHAAVAANICLAGLRASESARRGTVESIPTFT